MCDIFATGATDAATDDVFDVLYLPRFSNIQPKRLFGNRRGRR